MVLLGRGPAKASSPSKHAVEGPGAPHIHDEVSEQRRQPEKFGRPARGGELGWHKMAVGSRRRSLLEEPGGHASSTTGRRAVAAL